jgi:hypothetical protein
MGCWHNWYDFRSTKIGLFNTEKRICEKCGLLQQDVHLWRFENKMWSTIGKMDKHKDFIQDLKHKKNLSKKHRSLIRKYDEEIKKNTIINQDFTITKICDTPELISLKKQIAKITYEQVCLGVDTQFQFILSSEIKLFEQLKEDGYYPPKHKEKYMELIKIEKA